MEGRIQTPCNNGGTRASIGKDEEHRKETDPSPVQKVQHLSPAQWHTSTWASGGQVLLEVCMLPWSQGYWCEQASSSSKPSWQTSLHSKGCHWPTHFLSLQSWALGHVQVATSVLVPCQKRLQWPLPTSQCIPQKALSTCLQSSHALGPYCTCGGALKLPWR